MEFDLHIHTNRYSGCSNIGPVEALRKAIDVGLEGVALTEHGIRWSNDAIKKLMDYSGVTGLAVIAGEEVACYSESGRFQGEFLVFGYPTSLGSSKPVEKVIDLVHKEGGVVIAAHPFKKMAVGDGYYGCGEAIWSLQIDGLEVAHPSYSEENRQSAMAVMNMRGLAGIGCSDAHELSSIGICRTFFEKPVTDVYSLCEEIRQRCVKAINSALKI